MKKFKTMSTLLEFLLGKAYPESFKNDTVSAMRAVEQCNESYLIITESQTELEETESEYNLKERFPETDEYINADGARWQKRVYVFDDYGNGIVLYNPAPADENRTE